MASLLDMLINRNPQMDTNAVLDRRMAAAGIPNDPRAPAPQNVQPVQQQATPPSQYSMSAMMAKIQADRVAQRRMMAREAMSKQNGQVLPGQY